MMRAVCIGFAALLVAGSGAAAEQYRFGPFKDELFRLPKPTQSNATGSYVVIPFSIARDLNGRDEKPEVKAKDKYVSLGVDKDQKDLVLKDGKLKVPFVAVGDIRAKSKSAFIFVHGKNGNRFQGVDDWTFGGNFNRLKNLMRRNGGIYLSPGLTDAKATGVRQAKLLMTEFAKSSPGAPIFLACASNGGNVCWALASDPHVSSLIGGMFLLGATSNVSFLDSPAGRDKAHYIPIYIGHGSNDKVINYQAPDRFFRNMQALRPDYPIRFVLFDTGSHGTPMRMTDWRQVLNWMLQVDGR